MSFLFHKRTKKIINVLWAIIAVCVTLSMILLFAPGIVNLFTQ